MARSTSYNSVLERAKAWNSNQNNGKSVLQRAKEWDNEQKKNVPVFNIQTSYGYRPVYQEEYKKMVKARQAELEEERKQQRQNEMDEHGINTPGLISIYNQQKDLEDYKNALQRAGMRNVMESELYKSAGKMEYNPAELKLKIGANKVAQDKIQEKIENENNIINNQGREENDPAVVTAKKTLETLQGQLAETQKQGEEIQSTRKIWNAMDGLFNPNRATEETAQRLQEGLANNAQKGYQPIPQVLNKEAAYMWHMTYVPQDTGSADYIQWLEDGAKLGLYDQKDLNAMLSQSGRTTPYEEYKSLDDKQTSGAWDYRYGEGLKNIIGLDSAWNYGDTYNYESGRTRLEELLKHYQGLFGTAEDKIAAHDNEQETQIRGRLENLNNGIELQLPGEATEYLTERNDQYRTNTDYRMLADEAFYDAIMGQGAYNEMLEYNDANQKNRELDEELDRKLDEAWTAFEEGRKDDIYNILTGNEKSLADYISEHDYANDKIGETEAELKKIEKFDEILSGYEGIDGADYDPELDRGRETLWTYDDEYHDPNVLYATPFTNDVHRIYSFINKGKEYQAYLDFVAGGNVDNARISEAYGKTALLSGKMKRKFNDLYRQKRYDEASAFLDSLSVYLNDMYSDYEKINTEELAKQLPVTSSAYALGSELVSGPAGIARTFAGVAGDKSVEDPNSAWYASTRKSEQIQQGIADEIGGIGGKFYLQGMNTLRNMMNVASVSAMNITGPWTGAAGLAMFATQIYQDQTYKYLKETNDYNKACSYALLDAALETAEEMLPYEAIMSGGPNILLSWLKNSLSEAGEELTGATLGNAIEGLIKGRNEWEARRDQIYNEGGYTDSNGQWVQIDKTNVNDAMKQAQTQAMREKGQQIIENTLAGFVGGGLGAGYGVAQEYINTQKAGQQIRSTNNIIEGKTGADQLLELASGMKEGTKSKAIAEDLLKLAGEGKKISNYKLGYLTRTMAEESGEQVAEIAGEVIERDIREELTEAGATPEYVEEAAPVLAESVMNGGKMNKAEVSIVAKDERGKVLLESWLSDDSTKPQETEKKIKEAGGEAALKANKAVRELITGNARVFNVVPGSIESLRDNARVAEERDVQKASGHRTETGLDAIVNNEIVQVIAKKGDQYTIQNENGTTEQVNAAAVKAADDSIAMLMAYAESNGKGVSDATFDALAAGIQANKGMSSSAYISDWMNAYLQYRTNGQPQNSKLTQETLQNIQQHAQRMTAQWDQERLAKEQPKVTPGQGTVTFEGARYGTEEWNQKTRKAGTRIRQQVGLLAEIGTRLGNRIEIINDRSKDGVYGWEDKTGTIVINIGATDSTNDSRHVLTVAAHELTHWLEQNSPEQYKELRNYVFDSLRKQNVNLAQRVNQKINIYRGYNQELGVNEALAEIVADACDQVLTNENVAKELQAENQNLYQKIKGFAKDFVQRLTKSTRNEKGEVITDDSFESRMIKNGGQEVLDEIARIWMGARREAIGRQSEQQTTEQQAEEMLQEALDNPKASFSLEEPIEATKDGLVAVHNLNENKLLKTMKLGGFPFPSVAIVRAAMGFTKYGEISVVFGRNTIDPKTSRYNKVYGGDAWTPVYPSVEYKLDTKKLDKTMQRIIKMLPETFRNKANLVDLYETNLAPNINRKKGEPNVAEAIGSEAKKWMRIAYMQDTGKNIDYPTKQEDLDTRRGYSNEQVVNIANILGRELVEEAMSEHDPWSWAIKHPEVVEQIRTELNEGWRKKFKGDKNSRLAKLDMYAKDNFGPANAEYILRGADRYFKNGIRETTDIDALDKTLKETINEEEFNKWVNDLFSGIIVKRGIRNNKNYYTDYGNPRSWDQLHDEETLENVVKIMRAQEDKGENTFWGQSAIKARGTKDFKSIDEIRKSKGQLQQLSDEEYSEKIQEIGAQFSELQDELYDKREKNILIARDRVIDAIADVVNTSNTTAANISRGMKEWGYNLTPEQALKIEQLMKDISNMPTTYFEAKPKRAVDFGEVLRVIMPENTSDELKNALNERNIPYETYDGTDEDRLAKLNSVEGAQFSVRETDADYMAAVNKGDMQKAREVLENYAARKGYVRAYHGTNDFGFTQFDMDRSQNQIFVAYDRGVSETYVEGDGYYAAIRDISTRDFDAEKATNKELAQFIKRYGLSGYNREEIKEVNYLTQAEYIKKMQEAGRRPRANDFNGVFEIVYTDDFAEALPFGDPEEYISYTMAKEEIKENLTGEGGMYQLFVHPGKELVIDADGEDWNRIPFEGKEYKTRELAEIARERGYDSLRINNVEDSGGSGQGSGFGDIGIFFSQQDVKSADTITYDDAGNVIPLSERFNPEQKDIRYSVKEENREYMQAVRADDETKQRAIIKQAAEENGFDTSEYAYHGTDSFGFTTFDMGMSQDTIFVAYNPNMAATYTDKGVIKPISKAVQMAPEYRNMRKLDAEDLAKYAKTVIKKWNGGEVLDIQYTPAPGDWGLDERFELKIKPMVPWEPETIGLRRFELYEHIKNIVNPNGEAEGIYQLYTRPGKQLKVNARGNLWREIPFVMYGQPQITADGWYSYEESFDKEKYERNRLHYPTALTREIAEKAREWGYDSVRIYNVHDDGGRNPSVEKTGSDVDMGISGDIAIFFNNKDVKSADPVTYDDEGNIIPPSRRFTDDSNDIRFSLKEPDMEINRWMMGLTESSLRTTQEKMLWKQYKETATSLDMTRRFMREIQAKIDAIDKKEKQTEYDRFELKKLEGQLANWEAKRDQYEKQLLKAMEDEGYAAIMFRERDKMENLVNGRTEDEVRQTIDAITAELETLQEEMNAQNEKLKELAGKESVQRIRQQLNSAGLRRIAANLKAETGSTLQNKEIENRLALMALKMKQGKTDNAEIMELADMLISSVKPYYDSYVLDEMRGMTIALNEKELAELKNRGMTVRDLQQELTGTGIRIVAKGPNSIDKNWGELTGLFASLDKEAAPGNMLWGADPYNGRAGIMDLIEGEIAAQQQAKPNMDQVAAMVVNAAADLIPEIVSDAKSMQLIRDTMQFIGEINASTDTLDNINNMMDRLKKKSASAKRTLGDMENRIVDAIEYNNTLAAQSDVTNWKQERARLVERLKSEHTQAMLREQAKYRMKIERYKQAQDMMADNQSLRRDIHMDIQKIRKLLMNETDTKNIPENVKALAREMVLMIAKNDLIYDRKVTAIDGKELQETYRKIKEWNKRDGEFTIDDLQMISDPEAQEMVADALADIEEGLELYNNKAKLGNDVIVNLNWLKSALTKVQEGVARITRIIESQQSINIRGREIAVGRAAQNVINDLNKSKRKGEWQGFGAKGITAANRSIIYGNTTPVYFFKNLRNRGIDVLWDGFKDAENRNGLLINQARDFMAKLAEKYHYDQWDHNKRYTVTLNNMPVKMSLENMMAMVATWNREQMEGPEESRHMKKGGVYIEDEIQDKGKPHREKIQQKARRVTADNIREIESMLTDEQKAYIADVVSYLSNEMSELGNEASMNMYGIRKYNEKYYYPMKVWDGVKSARSDKGISGTTDNRIARKGWSKRRKHKAANALVIGKFTDTAVQHMEEMINYNTFAPVIEGMNKVLNWQDKEEMEITDEGEAAYNARNVRVMFQEAYGKEALRYLEDWMKDLQGGVTQDQRKTMRDRLISVFKKNAVAGSLSVTLQQPLSIIRAAMMINPKYLAASLSPKYWKGSYREMMENSGIAVIKQMGRFDMNFGQSARDWIAPKTKGSAYEKVSDILTAAPQLADTMTWTRMWSAVKIEQAAEHPGMDTGSKEFMDLVAERFNEVMRRTQVYDSILTKSSNMRSQALSMKIITSFMAEPTLSLNVLADAVMNAGEKGGKTNIAKAAATFMLSAIAQAAFKGFLGAGRSPDEKKTAAENLLNKILYNLISEANPISLIPGYSDLIEVLKNGELKDDAMGVIGKLKTIYTTAQNALKPEEGKEWHRIIEDTAGQLAQLFTNIPAKNLMRDGRAIYNWISGAKFADRKTSNAVLKYQAEASLMTADNLIGTVNSWLGEAGYKTTNKAYYGRMFDAMQRGNNQEAEDIKEYLTLAKGADEKAIESGLRTQAKEKLDAAQSSDWMIDNGLMEDGGTITTQYKKGEITAAEAKRLYKKQDPKLTDDEIWWKIDRADYYKETGHTESGYYYRLEDAVNDNKAAEIQKVVKDLLAHGITKEKIKNKLSDWKQAYLEADSAGKVKIRDALQKAYRAAGYTTEDANKAIEKWKKDAEKKK